MIERLSKQNTARDGIFAIINYHLSWVGKNPDWARFLFPKRHAEYMDESEAEMKRLNAEFAQGMSTWFQIYIKAGDVRPLPRDVIIALLLGPCQEFARMFISGYARTDVSTAVEALAEAAWTAIGTDI